MAFKPGLIIRFKQRNSNKTAESLNTPFQPVKVKDKIVLLDILRGFALLGKLFANLLTWSGLKYLPIQDIKDLGNIETEAFIIT